MAKGSFFNSSSPSNKDSKKGDTPPANSKGKNKSPKDKKSGSESENTGAHGADSLSGQNDDKQANQFFNRALWVILGTFVFMLLAFVVGFFVTLQSAEKTVIPHVEQMDLVDALIELQEKGLVPRIQVKYTSRADEKGMVVLQSPRSGQHVKIGRRVTLTVSQGAVVEEIGQYMGMTLDEVKLELQTIFASFQTTIQVGEVIYQYSEAPEGQIIGQEPAAGTPVTGLTNLTLVVSRGMEEGMYKVDNYTGYSYEEVMQQLQDQNIPFIFHIDEDAPSQAQSVVFRQIPAIGELVEVGTPLEFYINPLTDRALDNLGNDMVFQLFEYQLPRYLVPVNMRLERTLGATDPVVLIETLHAGGPIGIPYIEQKGSVLKLYMNGKEIISYYVQ